MNNVQRWRVGGVVTFVVAGVLLLSMGGAIVAAPATLPLMLIARSVHPTPAFRVAATVLSALTVAEVIWALTYLAVDEAKPWIWVLPSAGALIAAVAVARLPARGASPDHRPSTAT
ncbi:MAG: hypothetical protein ACR2HM_05205 [Acidimicrobiales bacterium]